LFKILKLSHGLRPHSWELGNYVHISAIAAVTSE
jgi:hypothetical protein